MRMKMRLEDAMIYALATAGRGMTTDQLAQKINEERLHVRGDGNPVTCARYMPPSAATTQSS